MTAGKTRTGKNPLDCLKVFSRLEVGPVRLEKRRLKMPYRVFRGRKAEKIDLIYRFEEDVFDPATAESMNLAGIIGAQVALNYGLFCDRIIFRGLFDLRDQKFIRAMAANTAREIYVKKFLEHNPFLLGKAANLPVIKKRNYLLSQIVFENEPGKYRLKSHPWNSDPTRYTVLSSGGKDSLLSFGLLDELGYDTHPIYINESGRHWYTALNAYRHFANTYPNTSRVWTNADRVYNWMLRQLPFIRQDFATLRADEYPIRLWTVAVFIFGALPLIRKRGIGRIVIGNEYDTTRRLRRQSIPHYDGLYDQSRFFDNALSRYYRAKGWGLHQFSMLRPLSEMLIEKILVTRYPDLQRHQVSCHATHIGRGRVLPCGDCEKCRRIVGMLMALDADPRRCGYTQSQIADVLKLLSSTQLRQDAASAEHLAYLLRQKGLIKPDTHDTLCARPHPQVTSLMFGDEKSRLNEIPPDLRDGLMRIYHSYADSTVCKRGRSWIPVKLK